MVLYVFHRKSVRLQFLFDCSSLYSIFRTKQKIENRKYKGNYCSEFMNRENIASDVTMKCQASFKGRVELEISIQK